MAVGRSIENISKDLTGNLERDLNIFVRTVITDLSTKQNSPVDTGFFASLLSLPSSSVEMTNSTGALIL